MVTSKRIIYLIKIGVGTLVLEVAKCTDAEWSLSTKFRLWTYFMWQFINTRLFIWYPV